MNKTIILISGKKGSGKTTLSEAISEHIRTSVKKRMGRGSVEPVWKEVPVIETFKYADPLYECHEAIWNIVSRYDLIPRESKSRDLLQGLGDFGRNRDPNLWVKITKKAMDMSKSPFVMCDDVRYPNEMLIHAEGAIRIRLECPEDVRKERCVWGDSQHSSETSLDEYVYLRTDEKPNGFDFIFDTSKVSVEQIMQALRGYFDCIIEDEMLVS